MIVSDSAKDFLTEIAGLNKYQVCSIDKGYTIHACLLLFILDKHVMRIYVKITECLSVKIVTFHSPNAKRSCISSYRTPVKVEMSLVHPDVYQFISIVEPVRCVE